MTVRLTVAQAVVRFLAMQDSERDGVRQRLIAGCAGIFGHGNVAGIGQALLEDELGDPAGRRLPYLLGRNEQGLVHAAAAYARHRDRLSTLAVTTSIGPGATNLVTGAALATVNRLPVLLLPGDVFATRTANPVLQELEDPRGYDVSVNDTLRPVSVFFDRVWRPEQLPAALLGAMRALTDPAATGAVTIALPQDVQAQAHDWPEQLFAERVWHIPRPLPEPSQLRLAADLLRRAQRPMIVAGGGVVYSRATGELRSFVDATGVPVGLTQAGKGALVADHSLCLGGVGATGTAAANEIAAHADLVVGIGTRWTDFTTASRSVFSNPLVRFVNINLAAFDAHKLSGVAVLADAREALTALGGELAGWSVPAQYRSDAARLAAQWDEVVTRAYAGPPGAGSSGRPVDADTTGRLLAQAEVLGAVEAAVADRDVVVCAAGSMPGQLHALWRSRDPKQYHVEYGYSCMGYEIAGGVGVALAVRDAGEDRRVVVLVGDGSYLMMNSELVTAAQEGLSVVVVLVDNQGFASIGALSESVGAQRFGTAYRRRGASGRLDGEPLDAGAHPVDLAANAASLGAHVIRARTRQQLAEALRDSLPRPGVNVVHVVTDPLAAAPDGGGWWDVPVAAVSTLESTRSARERYEKQRTAQNPYLGMEMDR